MHSPCHPLLPFRSSHPLLPGDLLDLALVIWFCCSEAFHSSLVPSGINTLLQPATWEHPLASLTPTCPIS